MLVVVPAEPGAGPGIRPEAPLAGLPLLRRTALAAARAGIVDVRLEASDTLPRDAATAAGLRRVILLPSNVIPQPHWLRGLREMPLPPDTLWVDSAMAAVIETERAGDVLEAARAAGGASELMAGLRLSFAKIDGELDPRGRFVLDSAEDVPAAETWLLTSLIKDSEGFMSRHVERRISLAVTRRLVGTGVTPNMMTIVSLSLGLAGAPFFLSLAPPLQVTGAFLFLLHSILDGCDGELARLKFLESRWGAVLDFWGDNVVHVAVFACMAVGWSLEIHAAWPLLLGGLACASTALAATAVAPHMVTPARPRGVRSAGARLADAVAHRDFIWVIIVLALFGRAAWFLVPVSTGTPLFILVRLWADRMRQG